MFSHTASPCFTVADVAAIRDFFVDRFGARVSFDCGWYVNLHLGGAGSSVQFMAPRGDAPVASLAGISLNFQVDDVDAEYAHLADAGLPEAMPLEDHTWGDRGFAVVGPLGLVLYLFSPRAPSPEFAGCCR